MDARKLTSVILWGPAGTGKTTIARLLADAVGAAFESLSAVSAGVKDVREAAGRAAPAIGRERRLDRAAPRRGAPVHASPSRTPCCRASRTARSPWSGATTENPFFEVNGPLLSRSTLFRLEPLDRDALRTLLERGLEAEGATIDEAGGGRARRLRRRRRPRAADHTGGGARPSPGSAGASPSTTSSGPGRPGRSPGAATTTTTSSAPSSRASAAATPTPACTGWPA